MEKTKPMPPLFRVDKNRVLRALCPQCGARIRSILKDDNSWRYAEACDKCGQKILNKGDN